MRILILENNETDVGLLQDAFARCGVTAPLHFVPDAETAIDYFTGKGVYANRIEHPLPTLLIIDLNLPKTTGIGFLEWFKKNPEHRVVPTLVLTSSVNEREIARAYELAANTYFVKPTLHANLCGLVKVICEYWSIAKVPARKPAV